MVVTVETTVNDTGIAIVIATGTAKVTGIGSLNAIAVGTVYGTMMVTVDAMVTIARPLAETATDAEIVLVPRSVMIQQAGGRTRTATRRLGWLGDITSCTTRRLVHYHYVHCGGCRM